MGSTALIIIDMLNNYEHEDAEPLMRSVRSALPPMVNLLQRARERDVLTVYVNDNHDEWTAERAEVVDYAMRGRDPSLVEPIIPAPDVPFIAKARHSAFHETQLHYMLGRFDIDRVVLAGQVTEQCIFYTAQDAYVRHYDVVVPRDAVAHIFEDLADPALRMMERNLHAEVVPAEAALTD